jgi:hypothetical protein
MYVYDHLAQIFLEWQIFQTKVLKTKHSFMLNNIVPKIVSLWDNVEKCRNAGQAKDNSMTHAHCMLNTSVYKHTRNTVEPWIASIIRSRNVLVIQNTRISKWIFP